MLRLVIEGEEFFDENTETFETTETLVLDLEHSLASLSKWEAKYQKPFLSAESKTADEVFTYLKFMVVTEDVDLNVLNRCSQKNIDEIQAYIDSTQSATTFGQMPDKRVRGEIITSELVYYWMIAFNIPFECQYWHLNRLFSLIRICNIKNAKPQKMSKTEIAQRNRELNAKRRAELNTSG